MAMKKRGMRIEKSLIKLSTNNFFSWLRISRLSGTTLKLPTGGRKSINDFSAASVEKFRKNYRRCSMKTYPMRLIRRFVPNANGRFVSSALSSCPYMAFTKWPIFK